MVVERKRKMGFAQQGEAEIVDDDEMEEEEKEETETKED